jgi:opacity protein-like surface antigen
MNRTMTATAICLTIAGVPAFAQNDQGATVGASVAALNMTSATSWSFSGSAGYQFSRMMAIEIEATAVPRLKSSSTDSTLFSATPSFVDLSTLPRATFGNGSGRAVFFTTNIRVQLPTSSARVTPYFVAGGGAASIRQTTEIVFPNPLAAISPTIPIVLPPITQHFTQSATDLALTLGGGVDVAIAQRFSVGGDFRYYRVFADQDSNVGRFGASVRYRF